MLSPVVADPSGASEGGGRRAINGALIRLGLIGYAATAIVAWYLTGPRYDVAYLAKAIEVGLIALLLVEVRAYDGSPIPRIRRALRPTGA